MKRIKKSFYKTTIIFCATAALWFTLDFVTKGWAQSASFKPRVFIENILYLNFQKNAGIAFGIPLPIWFQISASIIIIGLLIYYGFKSAEEISENSFLIPLLLGIITGGAIGNLVDRIARGYVIDFIVLKPIPTFNIADIGITVGLIALGLLMLLRPKHH